MADLHAPSARLEPSRHREANTSVPLSLWSTCHDQSIYVRCLPCAWSPSLLEGQTSCEKCVNETLNKRVLIFTMDSLKTTLEAVKSGGPAGEIFVRTSLETVLTVRKSWSGAAWD
eukprot:766612-Hanusia_phi.AAC.8